MKKPGRAWVYPREDWDGRFPSLGGDEYGRRTLVLPTLGFGPTLVVALWTCRCPDCVESREQTARWEREYEDATDYALRLSLKRFTEAMDAAVVSTVLGFGEEPEPGHVDKIYAEEIAEIRYLLSEDADPFEYVEQHQSS